MPTKSSIETQNSAVLLGQCSLLRAVLSSNRLTLPASLAFWSCAPLFLLAEAQK
jgi:hypothetical protein